MKLKINSSSGFTLVELVVTILVGAIFAISTTTLVTTNAHLAQRSRDLVAVNSYVEGKAEELRSAGFAALPVGTSNVTSELPDDLNSSKNATVVITNQATGLKKAVIDVTFNDQGTQRNYSYTTYIGELGVGQY
jgi:prepilin-type N-terminal cleavage/methylation domain-containing protein